MSLNNQIIVVGGGLSGLSAAHTVYEHGGNVLLLDKNPFFGYVYIYIKRKIMPLLPIFQMQRRFLCLFYPNFSPRLCYTH